MKSRTLTYKAKSTIIKCCPFCKFDFIPQTHEYVRGQFYGAVLEYYCKDCGFAYTEYHDTSKVNKCIDLIQFYLKDKQYLFTHTTKNNKSKWMVASDKKTSRMYNARYEFFGFYSESEFVDLLGDMASFEVRLQNMEILS